MAPQELSAGPPEDREFVWPDTVALARREYRRGRERSQGMSLVILSAAALATTLPCLFVWFADARRRPDGA